MSKQTMVGLLLLIVGFLLFSTTFVEILEYLYLTSSLNGRLIGGLLFTLGLFILFNRLLKWTWSD